MPSIHFVLDQMRHVFPSRATDYILHMMRMLHCCASSNLCHVTEVFLHQHVWLKLNIYETIDLKHSTLK